MGEKGMKNSNFIKPQSFFWSGDGNGNPQPFSSSKDALFMLLTSVYGKAQGEPYHKPKHAHMLGD
jgi:hypothetical protein